MITILHIIVPWPRQDTWLQRKKQLPFHNHLWPRAWRFLTPPSSKSNGSQGVDITGPTSKFTVFSFSGSKEIISEIFLCQAWLSNWMTFQVLLAISFLQWYSSWLRTIKGKEYKSDCFSPFFPSDFTDIVSLVWCKGGACSCKKNKHKFE